MNRLLSIAIIVMLTGCTSVPVAMKFPEVPKDMLEACPDLKLVPETNKLSEVLPVVVDNYGQYYSCKDSVDSWIDWYTNQKRIFDSTK